MEKLGSSLHCTALYILRSKVINSTDETREENYVKAEDIVSNAPLGLKSYAVWSE